MSLVLLAALIILNALLYDAFVNVVLWDANFEFTSFNISDVTLAFLVSNAKKLPSNLFYLDFFPYFL